MINYQSTDNEESALEMSATVQSWQYKRSSSRNSDKKHSGASLAKINHTPDTKKFKFHTLLHELSNLKTENSMLKQYLAQRARPFRSDCKFARGFRNGTPSRLKPCGVCSKLLSKGYTTKFCPIHGYDT